MFDFLELLDILVILDGFGILLELKLFLQIQFVYLHLLLYLLNSLKIELNMKKRNLLNFLGKNILLSEVKLQLIFLVLIKYIFFFFFFYKNYNITLYLKYFLNLIIFYIFYNITIKGVN